MVTLLHLAESPCRGATGCNIAATVLLYLQLSDFFAANAKQRKLLPLKNNNKQIHFLLNPLNA